MKSLFAKKPLDAAEIEAVRFTISKMELGPSDVIVLRHPGRITTEMAEVLKDMVGKVLDGRKCIVLDGGLDIGILSKAEIERRTA